ncbi:MAG: 50S ribosomal protein P1 [Candidatus Heimdallarchaeota archaeon]|nr:50S ribosomal protein P1 [Candidatus Heimdallarchaeota archaeon]MCK4877458.1 50S ribosomal protein P1 [Candidatus Heimdallarchaeota archaeon]
MEYVYAALVLHELGSSITQAKVKGILEAAGAKVDESRVKALVAALKEVDINEALKTAVMAAAPAAAPAATTSEKAAPAAKEEKKEEEPEEDSDLGLSALFG